MRLSSADFANFEHNAGLFYEKGPINLKIAASYVSRNLWAVGDSDATNQYSNLDFALISAATRSQGTGNIGQSRRSRPQPGDFSDTVGSGNFEIDRTFSSTSPAL